MIGEYAMADGPDANAQEVVSQAAEGDHEAKKTQRRNTQQQRASLPKWSKVMFFSKVTKGRFVELLDSCFPPVLCVNKSINS